MLNLILFVAITPYTDIANAPVIVGVCCDMCPEKERYMREYQANLSIFEMVPGTQDNRVSFTKDSLKRTRGQSLCLLFMLVQTCSPLRQLFCAIKQ